MATIEVEVVEDALVPYSERFRLKGIRGFLFDKPPEDIDTKLPKILKKEHHEAKVWRDEKGGLAYAGSQFIFRLAQAGKGTPNPVASGKGTAMEAIKQAISVQDAAEVSGEGVISFTDHDNDAIEDYDSVLKHWTGGKKAAFKGSTLYTHRPYLEPGWEMEFTLSCAYPQWFSASDLHKLVGTLGLIGIGAGTPLGYGRFVIIRADPPEDINWI